jgi:hypothetical protein
LNYKKEALYEKEACFDGNAQYGAGIGVSAYRVR